jgi:DNA-binding PadR family transcriptional regulator
LKKLFEDSPALYWSGNNNEVYRALVSLHQAGLVSFEVQPQAHLPARKVYQATPAGRAHLRQCLLSAPEPPERKQAFLIQLAWADGLERAELDALLGQYEEEVQAQLMLHWARSRAALKAARAHFLEPSQARSPREALLWARIQEHWNDFYERELAWVRDLRAELLAREEEAHDDQPDA